MEKLGINSDYFKQRNMKYKKKNIYTESVQKTKFQFNLPFTLTLLSIVVLGTRFSGTLYRNSCRLLSEPVIENVYAQSSPWKTWM